MKSWCDPGIAPQEIVHIFQKQIRGRFLAQVISQHCFLTGGFDPNQQRVETLSCGCPSKCLRRRLILEHLRCRVVHSASHCQGPSIHKLVGRVKVGQPKARQTSKKTGWENSHPLPETYHPQVGSFMAARVFHIIHFLILINHHEPL